MQTQTDAFIVNTAFTGAVADKARNPHVPYSLAEIVADATACAAAGTAIGHFHVRTESGQPSNDPDAYARLFAALRATPGLSDLVIVASTSGRHGQTIAERSAVLALPRDTRPDMASLTLSSLNFATGASVTAPDDIRRLAEAMQKADVRPELEVFDLGMITFAHHLIAEGLITPPYYFNLILGNVAGALPRLSSLAALMAELPADSIVSLGGIGRFQLPAHRFALACAGGARTGLEDNLFLSAQRDLATNPALTVGLARMAQASQRALATPAEVRTRLALPAR